MYILKTTEQIFGAFADVSEVENGFICDGALYLSSVIGESTIEQVQDDWVNPILVENAKTEFNKKQKELRLNSYEKQCDPLFFKAQRGETTQQEWLDKVESIKLQYPYQE